MSDSVQSPRTGVSVLVIREDQALLVRRRREPFSGYWSLPGGAQEFGETMEEAARRELLEETGLTARRIEFAELFEPMLRRADGTVERHFVLALFVCTAFEGEAVAGDDASEVCWRLLSRLDDATMTPGTAAIIRRLALSHRSGGAA
jgi:mutator protein MutT